MNFLLTLTTVAVMLLYAVPGFLLIKSGKLKKEHIPGFSMLLLYVCQPFLNIYSIRKIAFSKESALNLLICFVITLLAQLSILLIFFFIFKKKRQQVIYRIINIATVFSNCGFLGVPLLEAMFPQYPEAAAYSCINALTMNLIGWSLGLYIISMDKKYISPKKIFINPATVSLAVALPFYFTGVELPGAVDGLIELLGRMSTPLCMLIMGMRLATMPIKNVFNNTKQYLAVVLNQLLYPLLVFLCVYFLPIDFPLKATLVVLAACPVASMVQNYAEILGQGQDKAANMVLLGTMCSVITAPVMCLLVDLL